jgi:hypothetical protein
MSEQERIWEYHSQKQFLEAAFEHVDGRRMGMYDTADYLNALEARLAAAERERDHWHRYFDVANKTVDEIREIVEVPVGSSVVEWIRADLTFLLPLLKERAEAAERRLEQAERDCQDVQGQRDDLHHRLEQAEALVSGARGAVRNWAGGMKVEPAMSRRDAREWLDIADAFLRD